MSPSDDIDTFGSSPFLWLSAVVLPLANVGMWAAIRFTGGAHGHGPVIAGAIVAGESILITLFCATKTEHSTARRALVGVILNVAVSIGVLTLIALVALVVGYAGGRAGD